MIIQRLPGRTVKNLSKPLARGSINRTLANALISVAPAELEFSEIPIGDLPLCAFVQRVTAANAPGHIGDPEPDAEKLSR